MLSENLVSGQVVVVTGAASGIGAETVAMLRARGAQVVGFDRVETEDAQFFAVDVTDEPSVVAAVEEVEASHGAISGLVNAAGILGKVHGPERLRLSDWQRELDVDLTGTFLVSRVVGTKMAARGCGAIVNIASIAGMSSAPTLAYSAAKAGVISLTQSLAQSWGRSGVRVNAVSPGFTRTPALEAGITAGVLSAAKMQDAASLGRLLEVSEIAEVIAFLLSEASSGVTGINLPVDAGYLCGVSWLGYSV